MDPWEDNMRLFDKAEKLIYSFKKDSYSHGTGVLSGIGRAASRISNNAVLFRGTFPGIDLYTGIIKNSLEKSGVQLGGIFKGSRPNTPRQDLIRAAGNIRESDPGLVISLGGGSTIDAVKAAAVLAALGGEIDDYLGADQITAKLRGHGRKLIPHIACQTLAGSAAHLTRYSNITDLEKGQKKLIVDDSIVPEYAVFDYSITYGAPKDISADGGFDGLSHLIEVLYSAEGSPGFDLAYRIAETGIELIIRYLPDVVLDRDNSEARDGLCLGTDLGGYAIMTGGTNGGHLTSFSLVDILSHGRACAIMNPYYSVFFAPAVERSLRLISGILAKYGYAGKGFEKLSGRELGIFTARGLIGFAKSMGYPTRLEEVEGFSQDHIEKALKAAREPALSMKLRNMPIPLTADMVDRYMGKVLQSAVSGDLDMIENL
jgi:alcohol dehydrogenase